MVAEPDVLNEEILFLFKLYNLVIFYSYVNPWNHQTIMIVCHAILTLNLFVLQAAINLLFIIADEFAFSRILYDWSHEVFSLPPPPFGCLYMTCLLCSPSVVPLWVVLLYYWELCSVTMSQFIYSSVYGYFNYFWFWLLQIKAVQKLDTVLHIESFPFSHADTSKCNTWTRV